MATVARLSCLAFMSAFLNAAQGTGVVAPPRDGAAAARAFVAAFNARAIDDMLALATDDVEWLSVEGAKVTVEAAGKNALRKSMTAYFKSCPTCRSDIDLTGSTPARVAAIETASWQTPDGVRSQRSLSVYELQHGLIRRVYYFPAERSSFACAAPAPSCYRTGLRISPIQRSAEAT